MSRRIPIFYSAVLLTGVNLVLRMISTGFQVYLSGHIGPAGIGLVQLVLSVGSLATTAGIAGIRTATMYLTAQALGTKQPGNVWWVLSGCLRYALVCSVAVGAILYFFADGIAGTLIGAPAAADALRLLGLMLPVTCLCACMCGYFTAAKRIGTLAAVEIAEQLCGMAVTVAALRFFGCTDSAGACMAVVLGMGCGSCISFVCLAVLRVLERPPRGKKVPCLRRLVDTALPLGLADDLKAGITTAENLMVPGRLALCPQVREPLALFGTVCGMVFPVMMFPACILFGLCELLVPELAQCHAANNRRRIVYLLHRGLKAALIYGVMCAGLEYLLAPTLCLKLYGSALAGEYLRQYSLLIPMLYCDAVTDAMIKGLGQQRICVRYNIVTSVLDLILLWILLPKYGMQGYFASFILTHLLNFLLSLGRLIKISGISASALPVLRTLLCGIAAAAFAAGLPAPGAAAMYLILLPGLLYLTGAVSREDLGWFLGLVWRKSAKNAALNNVSAASG